MPINKGLCQTTANLVPLSRYSYSHLLKTYIFSLAVSVSFSFLNQIESKKKTTIEIERRIMKLILFFTADNTFQIKHTI